MNKCLKIIPLMLAGFLCSCTNADVDSSFYSSALGSSSSDSSSSEPTVFKVTFKNKDGTVLDTEAVEYGQEVFYKGETPTNESDDEFSYAFKGWDGLLKPIVSDTTLTAVYYTAPVTGTAGITYNYSGEECSYSITGYSGADVAVCVPENYDDGTNGSHHVTSIGDLAFSENESLKAIMVSSSVKEIGVRSFSQCNSLCSIASLKNVTKIGDSAFASCKKLPSSLDLSCSESIGEDAFAGSSIASLRLTSSLLTIGSNAFSDCDSLFSLGQPDSLVSIGKNAFDGCISLPSFSIPSSLTSIGSEAFKGCTDLDAVNIPSTVETIGSCAFWTRVVYCEPESKPVGWDDDFFANWAIYYVGGIASVSTTVVWGCSGQTIEKNGIEYVLSSVSGDKKMVVTGCDDNLTDGAILPSVNDINVVEIAGSAFARKWSLTSIKLSSTITTIGSFAFGDDYMLTTTEIPSSILTIGDSAFYGCFRIDSLIIPLSVKTMGTRVFFNTDGKIFCEASSLPEDWDADWGLSANYYWYFESNVSGYWHYVDGVPTLW